MGRGEGSGRDPAVPAANGTRDGGRPLRVAYVIDSLRRDGAQRALVQLVEGLAGLGYEQRIYALNDRTHPAIEDALRRAGAEVRVVGRLRLVTLWGLLDLWRDLRSWRPDLVQTLLPFADPIGRVVARAAGVPTVVSSIRARDLSKRPWQRALDRATLRLADRVVFNSRNVVPYALEQGEARPEQVVYIPNGIERPEAAAQPAEARRALRREIGVADGTVLIGTVGRLYPQKAHHLLIDALSELRARGWDVSLVIVGDGPLRGDLEARAEGLGLGERVLLLGERADVWRILAAMDVYAHAALFEGMPNAVMEAMLAELPVVASAVDGVLELIEDGRSGWLVPPGDARALADRLAAVLEDPEAAARVAAGGAARVERTFTVERCVTSYDELYRDLLSAAGQRGNGRT